MDLAADKAGNFAMLSAIILPVLLVAGGSVVDYSNAVSERTKLQGIADAAVLAAGGVFDGTNFPEAKVVAEKFIAAHSTGALDEDASPREKLTVFRYKVSALQNTMTVTMSKPVPTTLMKLASIDAVDVSVTASALSPMKPEKITLKPTKVKGWYYKKISILVLRKDATEEEVVGTVTYQPTTQLDSGKGPYTVKPRGVIKLGSYTNLALRMDVKKDGCDIGKKANVDELPKVVCEIDTSDVSAKYDYSLRTDDPATSHYLFVDGQQLPEGVTASLEKYFGCRNTQKHDWEDGGDFDEQDFFYDISATCAPDGTYVRLIK